MLPCPRVVRLCVSVTLVHPAKVGGRNEMPFGMDPRYSHAFSLAHGTKLKVTNKRVEQKSDDRVSCFDFFFLCRVWSAASFLVKYAIIRYDTIQILHSKTDRTCQGVSIIISSDEGGADSSSSLSSTHGHTMTVVDC